MLASQKDPQSAMIPKYSMMGPFKGHMSSKSSPAVDTSIPKTLLTSIKYTDQQKRERLKAAIMKYQKEFQRVMLSTNHRSPSPEAKRSYSPVETAFMNKNQMSRSNIYPALASQEAVPPVAQRTQPSTPLHFRSLSPIPSPVFIARETMQEIALHASSGRRSRTPTRSFMPCSNSVQYIAGKSMKKSLTPHNKTYSGDVLDKHPKSFTRINQPFTPRTLKKASKSFLSKYRYYAPPKKVTPKSANRPADVPQLQFKRSQKLHHDQEYGESLWGFRSSRSAPAKRELPPREEELRYLQFLEGVTSDILLRGCYSNKILESIFQKHIDRRKYDLNEVKMRNILEDLKRHLNSTSCQLDFSISYTGEHRCGVPLADSKAFAADTFKSAD
ncbi:spermatogenesis-associated protein 7-like isoform X2 [Polyodon spathula]|uniref:spermatogenesis-associated protein 7-like isoform X2 n=1 Tax=Polyodon spathula TaxID=7913 RepID=UPI001B7DC1A6|nr:spermatogenesis-associated protein 7-like isoform X2 [Polyodon spathula]